jgi:hypothetical protein
MTMDAIRPNSGDTPPLVPQPDARPEPRFSIAGRMMAGKGAQCTTRISEALIPKPRQRTTSLPTPVDATAYLRDVMVPRPAPACGERRADMPETDLHTAEGQLRRDVAIKVLERIEHRLAQLAEETAKPRVQLAAQRQRRAIRGMLHRLHERGGAESSPAAPETAATPVSAGRHSASPTLSPPSTASTQVLPADTGSPNTGSPDAGLDISDSAKLVQVLRETRKAVCAGPSPLVRFWQLLFPRPWKKAAEHQPDALLDMLLRHFDVQVLGGWAALERGRIEASLKESYAAYAHAGESRSTFLGGVGTVPVGVLLPGVSAGVVVGATILGRDLGACEDGDIEQSKWWSGTLGGALMAHFGVIAGKLSLSGTATRKEGVFFNDVDHLLASRQGTAHHDVVNGPRSGRFKQAMGRMRFTRRTNLTLATLDAMQEKAYAQRDIFAKVVGPVSMPSADGEEALHMVGVHRRAPDAPLPCAFTSTEAKVTAGADAQAGVSGLLAANLALTAGYARMGLTVRPRVDFWRAVREGGDDGQADSRKDRAAELRAVGARIEPALAHLRSVPAAMAARNAADEPFRIETATASELSNVLADMKHEFDRYCYARRQIHDGMPRHARQARAIESSWGVKESGQAVYAYVQRLRIIHALIGLRLQALGHGGDVQFEQFGRKLDAPDMTVYALDKAKPHISFIDERDLVERSTPIALKAGVSLLGEKSQLSVSAGVSVSARAEVRERSDWNILRDGNYLDVSFDINLDASLTLHIPAIGELLLDKASALGLDQGLLGKGVEQAGKALKEMLVLSPQGSVARRVTLRYYQPRGAKGLDKMRLQHLRITRSHSGPIHQRSHLLVEKLGVETLSYMFVRHHAFFDNKGEAGKRHWDDFCALHPEALHQMLSGLGRPGSKIRTEAERYWEQTLDCAADEAARQRLLAEREAFFQVMSRYASSQEADGQPWEDGKLDRAAFQAARSALDAFAAAHMAPWRHGRDQHTRRNARIKLLD